ncbi:MAG: tRNA epoxyqueuosine(34) reductase QueG [Hyphomicrobium sp.]|nr:tRNA epoxyqueuosine(34) reductase QueG [Hyphomicrobium sp.]
MEAGGPQATRLRAFLDAGRHGDMEWMELTADRRGDPLVLWPEARSAVMVAMSYAPPRDPMDALGQRDLGIISVYAQGKDYHEILKPKLKHLAREVVAITSGDVKVFVDTAPLMEKPLAALAGLGWQGKHTNLVSRVHGSWLFLGALLTTAELDPDEPEADHCGSCRRCLDICPTAAFPAPYQLDARRCIAYLTIEHKGQIGQEFRTAIGNRIFGCDDCLAVCPWNKFAAEASEIRFAARSEAANPPIAELLTLTDDQFRARFAGTPVKRTGRDRFVRNVLIAAGNSDDQTLLGKVRPLLDDASPLVRGMAVWALSRLASEEMFQHERSGRYEAERDPGVRAEWMTETT